MILARSRLIGARADLTRAVQCRLRKLLYDGSVDRRIGSNSIACSSTGPLIDRLETFVFLDRCMMIRSSMLGTSDNWSAGMTGFLPLLLPAASSAMLPRVEHE